jgi:hypothetical protein
MYQNSEHPLLRDDYESALSDECVVVCWVRSVEQTRTQYRQISNDYRA